MLTYKAVVHVTCTLKRLDNDAVLQTFLNTFQHLAFYLLYLVVEFVQAFDVELAEQYKQGSHKEDHDSKTRIERIHEHKGAYKLQKYRNERGDAFGKECGNGVRITGDTVDHVGGMETAHTLPSPFKQTAEGDGTHGIAGTHTEQGTHPTLGKIKKNLRKEHSDKQHHRHVQTARNNTGGNIYSPFHPPHKGKRKAYAHRTQQGVEHHLQTVFPSFPKQPAKYL